MKEDSSCISEWITRITVVHVRTRVVKSVVTWLKRWSRAHLAERGRSRREEDGKESFHILRRFLNVRPYAFFAVSDKINEREREFYRLLFLSVGR